MSSKLLNTSFHKKRIQFDPRTKLLVLITLCTLMLSTSNGGLMMYLKPLLALIPFVLLLLSEKYIVGILYFVLYTIGFGLEIFWGAFENAVVGLSLIHI